MQTSSALALLLFAILTSLAHNRIIQVPYLSIDDTLYLKLDELHAADSVFKVFGDLNRIYQK